MTIKKIVCDACGKELDGLEKFINLTTINYDEVLITRDARDIDLCQKCIKTYNDIADRYKNEMKKLFNQKTGII